MPDRVASHPTVAVATRVAFGIGLFVLIATSAACNPVAGVALADRVYLSTAVVEGGSPKALVAGTQIRLEFRDADLGASAGCNSMGGTYRIEGGVLVFEAGGMTAMGCDPEREAQDTWLMTFLASRPVVRQVGTELSLETATATIRFQDREVAQPDQELVGPTWTVEAILVGDTVSSVPAGAVATLVFRSDGTVEVSPGCNRGGGTWLTVAGGISIGGIGLTKMACMGAEGRLEADVMAVLNAGQLAAGIDANMLTLQAAGRGLLLRAS